MKPSPTDVMLWSSVASSVGVILLLAITAYYAWYVKRQADATRSQAEAANKQSEVVQQGLNILVEQQRQQRETDIARVKFQLEAGIQTLDGWKDRLNPGGTTFPQLPAHPAEVQPVNFLVATKSADQVDPGVAALMQTALYFITEAEIAINLLGATDHSDHNDAPWMEMRDKAVSALNVARSKLGDARTRLDGLRRFA